MAHTISIHCSRRCAAQRETPLSRKQYRTQPITHLCRSGGLIRCDSVRPGWVMRLSRRAAFRGNMCAAEFERCRMNQDDFPAPTAGFVLTHFLVVADQDRSREFYRSLFDGQVLVERDPVIMKVANSWLILNVGGGPTDDKPTVTLTTPPDLNRTSAFLNVRVADIARVYQEWSARGAH